MYCCKMQMQMCQSCTWRMEILEIPSSSSKSKRRRRTCSIRAASGWLLYIHLYQPVFVLCFRPVSTVRGPGPGRVVSGARWDGLNMASSYTALYISMRETASACQLHPVGSSSLLHADSSAIPYRLQRSMLVIVNDQDSSLSLLAVYCAPL
jgi:hypothetical protein